MCDSLLLGGLAGGGALFLEVVDELLALFECPLKETGSAGADRRERGSDIGVGRRCRKLGREVGVALIGHALRVCIVIALDIIEFGLLRSRRQDVQTGRGIDSGLCAGLRLDGIDLIGRHGRDRLGLGLKRRLLALLVIERARLGEHAEGADSIRAKADVAGSIAIELGLGLDDLNRSGLLGQLGSGLIRHGLLRQSILVLGLGSDDANQGLVGRGALESINLLTKGLVLRGLSLGSGRLAKLVLGIGRLFVLDGIAVIVLLLSRGILGRRARHLLGTTLLLAKIRVKRNIVGELILALIGGDVIHDAQHGGNRRLVADRTRCIGKDKAVGNDIGCVRERHEGGENRNDPQQDLQHTGKRQDAKDSNCRGSNRGDREQLGDQRAIRRIRLAGEQLSARGVIMRYDDDRAIARRRKRARRLVVGDDVLAHARLAQARDHGAAGSLKHIEHGSDDGQQGSDQTDTAANTHKQSAGKCQDTRDGKRHPTGRGGIKLLHLGIKAVVAEDLSDILGSQALFFAARRRDASALQQVVDIVLGVRHVRSTSIIRQIGPMHAH